MEEVSHPVPNKCSPFKGQASQLIRGKSARDRCLTLCPSVDTCREPHPGNRWARPRPAEHLPCDLTGSTAPVRQDTSPQGRRRLQNTALGTASTLWLLMGSKKGAPIATLNHWPVPRPTPLSLPALLLMQQQGEQAAGERHQQQAEHGPHGLAPLREPLALLRVVPGALAVEAHPAGRPHHSATATASA